MENTVHTLSVSNKQLPENIDDLSKFVLVGREKLVAVRAEIRAIDRVGLARDVREQKLAEAQDIAEAVLDAEVKIGELISNLPKSQGKRSDLKLGRSAGTKLMSKREIVESAGFSKSQGERFELLAKHPDVVEHMKAVAREQDDIVSRTAVLQAIASRKSTFIVNNSGDTEWYTPAWIIESARKVMSCIDLDPCTTEKINETTIHATTFYTKEQDGLKQEWHGKVFLNPPYSAVCRFVDKLCDSDVDQAIVLTNNATETAWFKKLVERASAIVFLTGRVHFVRPDDRTVGAPLQGQCLTYIGDKTDVFLDEFSQYGWGARLDVKR